MGNEQQLPPLPLADRMFLLRNTIYNLQIPLFEGLDQAYWLAAERYDLGKPAMPAKKGLEEALDLPSVHAAYELGLNGGYLPPRGPVSVRPVISAINSSEESGNLIHLPILEAVTGIWYANGNDQVKNFHWNRLHADIAAELDTKMQGVVYLDALLSMTHKKVKAAAAKLLNETSLQAPVPGHETFFFKPELEETQLYKGYSEKISPILETRSEEVFGADASVALGIARALIFMNTLKLNVKHPITLSSYRLPILHALGQHNLAHALHLIQDLVITHSTAFSKEERASAGVTNEIINVYNNEQTRLRREQAETKREQLRLKGLKKTNRP